MNKYTLAFRLLKKNYKTVLLFELFYKLIGSTVFTPLLFGMLNLALKLSGEKYLTNDNFFEFLRRPSTVAIALIILLAVTLFTLFEMTALVQCFHASFHNNKMTVAQMFQAGYRSAFRLFRRRNGLIVVFVLFIIPITNFAIVSGYISSIKIPEFIMDYIYNNWLLSILLLLCMLLFAIITLRWVFSIHVFTLEGCNYKKARKESLRMNRGRYIKHSFGIIVWNISIALIVLLFTSLSIGAVALVIKSLTNSAIAYSMTLAIVAGVLLLVLIVFSNFSVAISFAFISALYYKQKRYAGEEIPTYRSSEITFHKFKKFLVFSVLIAAVINIFYLSVVTNKNFDWNVQLFEHTQVSAHRGNSSAAPENTMPAFQSAIEQRADYIELDVQQTKDGVIVVAHDSNLKRISGKSINIWEVTYDEIKHIDVGSWFHSDFSYVRLSTLEEVIKETKGKIKLNIELKPSGHEVDFEKSVVDLIKEYRVEDDCVVASMNYECLKRVKEYAPDIKTVYITTVAYGSLLTLEHADVYSIEASFVTSKLVNDIHRQGKEIYAWTVNNESNVQKMIDVGVDNVITDNPVMVRELVYSKTLNENIVDFIYRLINK